MKLIAGIVASAAASISVICNNGNAVEMTMSIPEVDVVGDVDGFQLANGIWTKSVIPSAGDTTTGDVGGTDSLIFDQTVTSSGCDEEIVDGVTVCVAKGHTFTFSCSYPLTDQEISSTAFTVAGSDTISAATNVGSLHYALTVDSTSAYEIGSTVTATITPSSPDLVTATIKTCNVEKASSSVSLIDEGLDPVCALGVAIANGQDTSNLSFSWSSFKWNTATVGAAGDESQSLKCTIGLAKAAAPVTAGSC